MAQQVLDILAAFDGRHVEPLRALVSGGVAENEIRILLSAVPGPNEVAATWVLKELTQAGAVSVEHSVDIFGHLGKLTEDHAILHVLQMVQHRPGPASAARDQIETLLGHKKLLVQVWALDALARINPEVARPLVVEALDAPRASMRARARALLPLVGGAET